MPSSAGISSPATTTPSTLWCHECETRVRPPSILACPTCHSTSLEDLRFPPPSQTPSQPDFVHHLAALNSIFHSTPGATRSDAILAVEITGADDLELCAVCKDEIAVGSDACRLLCSHLYHAGCILPWLAHRNSCPVCRYEISADGDGRRRRGQSRRVTMARYGSVLGEDTVDLIDSLEMLGHIRRNRSLYRADRVGFGGDCPESSGETVEDGTDAVLWIDRRNRLELE